MEKHKILKGAVQPEARLLLSKVLDQADFCLGRQRPAFTEFLDPQSLDLCVRALERETGLCLLALGGQPDCERRILGMFPEDMPAKEEAFPLSAVRIVGDARFGVELSHRNYLGAILGLGLDRNRVGDIWVSEDRAWCFLHRSVADFVCENLTQVGRRRVRAEECPWDEAESGKSLEVRRVTLASLRLDAVAAEMFRLSRAQAKSLVLGEKVLLNWRPATDPAAAVAPGDVLSVRGYGRGQVLAQLGVTKKDRLLVELGVYR